MSRGSRAGSRPRKTWPRPSGSGSGRSFPAACCGRSGSGRPTRTGLRSVTGPEVPGRPIPAKNLNGPGRELRRRYVPGDVGVFTRDEARRFVPRGDGDPHQDVVLAWELLYRLEPELYAPVGPA